MITSVHKLTAILVLLLFNYTGWAATYTVTSNADSGPNTLRQAITDANATTVKDVIYFNLGASIAARTITLSSALPGITQSLTIDGSTEPNSTDMGNSGARVILDGVDSSFNGLSFDTDSIYIYGLYITHFDNGIIDIFFGDEEIDCIIGGPGKGNIISANASVGIKMGNSARRITVQSNFIGTDETGNAALGNGLGGIATSWAIDTGMIGGPNANEGNVISANGGTGFECITGTTGLTVQNNKIGIGYDGTTALGNATYGIYLDHIESYLKILDNVISDNGTQGVRLVQIDTDTLLIQGNYIGTDATGTLDRGNVSDGFFIVQINAFNVVGPYFIIGGTGAGEGNVISGNGGNGMNLTWSYRIQIYGNYVGTNAAGTARIANVGDGILLQSTAGVIWVGGTTAAQRNIISGNGGDGLQINADSTIVYNNYFGLNAAGTDTIGNKAYGIFQDAGTTCEIGGSTSTKRNVISGNANGVRIDIATCTFQGNYVGTDVTGLIAKGNTTDGVYANCGLTVGGTAAGEGNVICSNGDDGIEGTFNSSGLKIYGNYIGIASNGTTARGNGDDGIYADDLSTIGGNTSGHRNVISNNGGDGIEISATSVTVQGNYIGTNASGTGTHGNGAYGIYANGGVSSFALTIGGTAASEGNVIANSTSGGIYLDNCDNSTIRRNYIGVLANGTTAGGNGGYGIYVDDATTGLTIGGSGYGNIIANAASDGIYLYATDGTTIQGNYIGTDASSNDQGNGGVGIKIIGVFLNGADNHIIGGSAAGAGNTIAYNNNVAVDIEYSDADNNLVSRNSMFCNSQSVGTEGGITLTASGNNNIAAPTISAATTSNISGTLASCTGCTIELFAQDNSCMNCEGMTYVGSATTDGSGNWAFTGGAGTFMAAYTVTVTDASNNTSPFSSCTVILPVVLSSFSGETTENAIQLNWVTEQEINSDYFTLERSSDGIHFSEIATVKGQGSSNTPTHYEYLDENAENGNNYYRLSQTDFDGSINQLNTIVLNFHRNQPKVAFDQRNQQLQITKMEKDISTTYQYLIYNHLGASVLSGQLIDNISTINLSHVASGKYFLKLIGETDVYQSSIIKL